MIAFSRNLARAFVYAGRGVAVFLRQRNARVHVALSAVACGLGAWLGLDAVRWCVLALTIALVLAAEALNTAIECVVDLASPGRHPLARDAKDVAAGAVLITAIAAVVVGCVLFLPPLLAKLRDWTAGAA
jgi:diacylglycerol kinase